MEKRKKLLRELIEETQKDLKEYKAEKEKLDAQIKLEEDFLKECLEELESL